MDQTYSSPLTQVVQSTIYIIPSCVEESVGTVLGAGCATSSIIILWVVSRRENRLLYVLILYYLYLYSILVLVLRGLRNSCPGGSQNKQNCCPGGDFNCCPGGILGGVKSRGLNCRYYSSTGCTSVLMQCGKVMGVVHVLLSRGE